MRCLLLHGKGGSPQGSVSKLQTLLAPALPHMQFERPALLHADPGILAETSLAHLAGQVPQDAHLIGISLGGLLAAALQEQGRDDLSVIALSAPTWADGVRLRRHCANRVAIYSSRDGVIAGRTADWPQLAHAYDLPWLSHDTDAHAASLAKMLIALLQGEEPVLEQR